MIERLSPDDKKADILRRIKKNLEILKKVEIYSEEWKKRESTLIDLLLNRGLSDEEKEVFGKQYDKIEGIGEYA